MFKTEYLAFRVLTSLATCRLATVGVASTAPVPDVRATAASWVLACAAWTGCIWVACWATVACWPWAAAAATAAATCCCCWASCNFCFCNLINSYKHTGCSCSNMHTSKAVISTEIPCERCRWFTWDLVAPLICGDAACCCCWSCCCRSI